MFDLSVENIPLLKSSAAFITSSDVFREDDDISPMRINDKDSIMPWGADNQMPFEVLNLIESDETLSTCQVFNAEVCYGSGLVYNTDNAESSTAAEVADFLKHNNIPRLFLGNCQDFKHFGFAVCVVILDRSRTKIARIIRKEACYCRFSPANDKGKIEYLYYANWRDGKYYPEKVEKIPLLDFDTPYHDLMQRLGKCHGSDGEKKVRTNDYKFAVVMKFPTPDSTYYPIPYYASLFKGSWFNIKRYIGVAKLAKLKNSAPIKYHIHILDKYWEKIFSAEGITDAKKKKIRINQEKARIIDFLTGAENAGKAIFSSYYINPNGDEQKDVMIEKIDSAKEGGDWESDIQEAVNMICFTMRVHSNLVGSVPGKAQTNNSGSDKRELFTIAHSLQKPYHDILFTAHYLVAYFNNWENVAIESPFIQLTTLDEKKDAKTVKQ